MSWRSPVRLAGGRPAALVRAGDYALPGVGDVDVDSEQAGEDCDGQAGGELEERGGAGLP
jgi:hypothetical protein